MKTSGLSLFKALMGLSVLFLAACNPGQVSSSVTEARWGDFSESELPQENSISAGGMDIVYETPQEHEGADFESAHQHLIGTYVGEGSLAMFSLSIDASFNVTLSNDSGLQDLGHLSDLMFSYSHPTLLLEGMHFRRQ
jgi:hypothetical protein